MAVSICFDLDGTLVSQHQYYVVSWRCGLVIAETLGAKGPLPRRVLDLFEPTEIELAASHRFSSQQFPLAWVETYCRLAHEVGLPVEERVVRRIGELAAQVHDGPFELTPHTGEVLERLAQAGHDLHVVTMGAPEVQERKLQTTGIGPFFQGVTCVGAKEEKQAAIRACLEPGQPVKIVVGDGFGAEVKAAVELGYHAVWVRSDLWLYHQAELPHGSYYTIDDMRGLLSIIADLDRS